MEADTKTNECSFYSAVFPRRWVYSIKNKAPYYILAFFHPPALFVTLNMRLIYTLILCLGTIAGFSQVDSTTPAFRKYPTFPPLQLLLGDSATKYTKEDLPKKKPVLIMLFSPECSHCQHTAEEMVKHKEELK